MSWTVEYGSDTYGPGQDWELDGDRGGISGLHNVKAKTKDLARNYGHGDFKGPHFKEAPVITIAVVTAKNIDDAACLALVDDLVAAWPVVADGTLETLTIDLPGKTYTMDGAPLSVDVDTADLKSGCAHALIAFKVYDAVIDASPGS